MARHDRYKKRHQIINELVELGFQCDGYLCRFKSDEFYCIVYLGEIQWRYESIKSSSYRHKTIEDVIENCGDELRDVILFNLDLFK